jgi:hypothetical protein
MKSLASTLTFFFALIVMQANAGNSVAATASTKSDLPLVQECVSTPEKPCGNTVEIDSLAMPKFKEDKGAHSEISEMQSQGNEKSKLFYSTIYLKFLNHSVYTAYYKYMGSYSGYWPSLTGIYYNFGYQSYTRALRCVTGETIYYGGYDSAGANICYGSHFNRLAVKSQCSTTCANKIVNFNWYH